MRNTVKCELNTNREGSDQHCVKSVTTLLSTCAISGSCSRLRENWRLWSDCAEVWPQWLVPFVWRCLVHTVLHDLRVKLVSKKWFFLCLDEPLTDKKIPKHYSPGHYRHIKSCVVRNNHLLLFVSELFAFVCLGFFPLFPRGSLGTNHFL